MSSVTCQSCAQEIDQRGPAVSSQLWAYPTGKTHRTPSVYIPFLEEWPLAGPPRRTLWHPRCFVDTNGIDAFLEAVVRHDHEARPDRAAPYGDEPVLIELEADERRLLIRGLSEWGGPAHPTREIAVAMGFRDVADLLDNGRRISKLLKDQQPMPSYDWTRALLCAEIVFASDVLGSGVEWPTTTGHADAETVAALRKLQRKLSAADVVVRPGYRTR